MTCRLSALIDPPLTTISQDLDAKASAAAALLKMKIDNPEMAGRQTLLDVKLAPEKHGRAGTGGLLRRI